MGYWALTIVPMTCAPVQSLLLKSGARYDVGAIFMVGVASLLTATMMQAADLQSAIFSGLPFIGMLLVVSILRAVMLARGEPTAFTVFSLALLLATVPFSGAMVESTGELSGLYTGAPLAIPYAVAFSVAICLITARYIKVRLLSWRLTAHTDSPDIYSIHAETSLGLAIRVEVLATLSYLAAGVLLALAMEDISAATFRSQWIWIILAATLVAKENWLLAPLGPFVVIWIRYALGGLPAEALAVTEYLVVFLVLAWMIFLGRKDLVARHA